jgi:hypothetical protein
MPIRNSSFVIRNYPALVAANCEVIARFEKKIQATLARIWGENKPAPAVVNRRHADGLEADDSAIVEEIKLWKVKGKAEWKRMIQK